MKKFLLPIILLSFLNIYAQQTKLLTAEKHNEYGLIYTLPTTAFNIEVVMTKETKIAGPYSKYAKIFTSTSQVIDKDEVKWNIEKVNITPFGVPNMENKYLMQLKAGALTYICVSDDGMLLAINKEVSAPETETLQITEIEGTPVSGKEYLQYVNEDFISAQSSYKQAQILAEEIMEIRDAKVSLTRGTADTMPTDGKQLEIMLASLENQEQALINAFTGASWIEKTVRSFTFIPEKEGKSILCKMSSSDGILDAKSSKGDPVYITVYPAEEAVLPVDAKGEEKKLPKDAVIYCVPGSGEITVIYGSKNLFQKEFPMSQFGLTFGLNPSIFTDKKEPSFAIFDPTTGALKELGTFKP